MANKASDSTILSWKEEEDEDEALFDGENSASDSDAPSEHSDHRTDAEQSDNANSDMEVDPDENEATLQPPQPLQRLSVPAPNLEPEYVGKDPCTKWQAHKPNNRRGKTQNIVYKLPGVKDAYKNRTSPTDCWKIFFSEETIHDIVSFTNDQLVKMQQTYKRKEKDCPQTDYDELLAFFGVLYMLGVKKGNHVKCSQMWLTDGSAPEFFRAVMSERRFHQLYSAIRFEDRRTRNERKKIDNLAPIRNIFQRFVDGCIASYTPGEFVTIDKMLEGFRGRCKFCQYVSNKPNKYGIKIYAMVDSRTFFTVNMEIDAGKQPNGSPYEADNSAAAVVKRLIRPIDQTGRNITMDDYYTSIPLANELYANHRTTIVGTIRKNKQELPVSFLDVKNRPVGSSMFGFGKEPNNTLLVSYVPKKDKNVLMLSTLHDDDSIDPETGDEHKPEVISFYNLTKGGVDVVDRMKKDYSVKRVNNRWPLAVFCGLLDLATVNAQIIYFLNTRDSIPRSKFIKILAMEIVKPHLLRRASVDMLSISLRQSIKNVLGQELPARQVPPASAIADGRKPRCAYCPVRKNRFTNVRCHECQRTICKQHTGSTKIVCIDCHIQEN